METVLHVELGALRPPRDLAALLRFVQTTPNGGSRAQREMASAISSFGSWTGKPLDLLPSDVAILRRHFAALQPGALGIKPQRMANVKSLLLRALALAGVRPTNHPVAEAVGPAWTRVLALLGFNERYLRTSLSPFGRFCDARGVPPEEVTDAVAADYLAHLEETVLTKKPRTTHQTVCRTWNKARTSIPGWPDLPLSVPSYDDTYSLELDAFPGPFRDELERYLARLACDDPVDLLDERAPPKPLRASSVRTKRYQIRAFASALVRKGVPIETITTLATLATRENFKLGLSHFLERPRADKESTRSAGAIAHTIRSIAKYHVQDMGMADLQYLNVITARLNRKETGLTDKNRLRLSQFDDEAVLIRFLDMPLKEMDRLRRKGVRGRNDAVEFSNLLAIEILLHVPLRVGNLGSLKVGQNVFLPAHGRPGETTISIGRSSVKNRQMLQYVLPEHVTALIAFHLDCVMPLLDAGGRGFLFPNGRDGSKRADTLSKQLSALVREKLGTAFNPHLARHLAAKLYIDARPGDYEGPRRLLAHSNAQTTYESYQGMEKKSAVRLHADLIKEKRRYIPLAERPRAGRRFRTEASMPLSTPQR
jgi:integrase